MKEKLQREMNYSKEEQINKEVIKEEPKIEKNEVDFEKVEPHTSAITPVPGGVGPMTIAMLMNNCVESMRGQK